MPLSRSSLAIVTVCATLSQAVAADPVSARYDISIAGMKVGAAAMNGAITEAAYEISATVRLQGMAKLVASGIGSATATGVLGPSLPQPSSYHLSLKMPDKSESVQMQFGGGSVRSLTAEPTKPPFPDQVPLTQSHQAGVVDPLSGGLFLSREMAGALSQDACAKTFPVFDGRQRYDIAFSFTRKDMLKAAGYHGPALVCSIRYKPIAGHSPAQVAFMQNNREMEIWLVPVAGTRVFLPGRIKIRTPVGLAVVEPTKMDVGMVTGSLRD